MQLDSKRLLQIATNDGLLISLVALTALVLGLNYDKVSLIGLGFGGLLIGSFRALFCFNKNQNQAEPEL